MEKVDFFTSNVRDGQWTFEANTVASELQECVRKWFETHNKKFSNRTLEYIAIHAIMEESVHQVIKTQRETLRP